MSRLLELGRAVRTREEFLGFLAALAAESHDPPRDWENRDLGLFLEALAAWARNAPAYYRQRGEVADVSAASWRQFAEMLLAARNYE